MARLSLGEKIYNRVVNKDFQITLALLTAMDSNAQSQKLLEFTNVFGLERYGNSIKVNFPYRDILLKTTISYNLSIN